MNDAPKTGKDTAGERATSSGGGAPTVPLGEPIDLFRELLAEATEKEIENPDAAALATANADGVPSVRMVLIKQADENGFVFYTNMESQKGLELRSNPVASLCFYWKTLRRSVRVDGPVEPVSEAEADAYFASRPRQARIGAWASDQSRPLEGALALEKRVAKFALKFHIGAVPRPPHWTGQRVIPRKIEFWRNMPFRLHERTLYTRQGDGWSVTRLYP